MTNRKKRALVITGAGASLEFGAPSTVALTSAVKAKVLADSMTQSSGSDRAYTTIADALAGYLQGGASSVTFEHIYHCAHELLFTFEPTEGAVNEFRPILQPFLSRQIAFNEKALRELVIRMAKFIFAELSEACATPKESLASLAAFIAKVKRDYVTRIYTTNYDDFLLQADPTLYTGFDPHLSVDPKSFDGTAFWTADDVNGLFHLHGSVHMAFGPPLCTDKDLGTLHWFDDRASALQRASYHGSDEQHMDGAQTVKTALITGFNKLFRLQQPPLSHYYASLARDALTADIIYVIGSSLSDLHLNTWLGEARRKRPAPPIVFVDKWPNSFLEYTKFDLELKHIEMIHALRMLLGGSYSGDSFGAGWTLATDRSCAVWDKGFLSFLNAPNELDHVLSQLT